MKKLAFAMAVTVAMTFGANAFAEKLEGYSSKLSPALGASKKANFTWPTNITVINASSGYIYVTVPNTNIYDYVQPRLNDHVYNQYGSVFTNIVLRDQYNTPFYSQVVCPYAIVTVHGYTGNYTVNTDSDLCR